MLSLNDRTQLQTWLEGLRENRLSPAEVERLLANHTGLMTWDEAEILRAEAEATVWHDPKTAWATAWLAHKLAVRLSPDSPQTLLFTLTLGITLNGLDRFRDALPLLTPLSRQLEHAGLLTAACRANVEITIAAALLGELETSQTVLDRARALLTQRPDALAQAYTDRAEGVLRLEQSRQTEAATLLQSAAAMFETYGYQGEAGIAACLMARAVCVSQPQAAFDWVNRASAIPPPPPGDAYEGFCLYIQGLTFEYLNRYDDSLRCYQEGQRKLTQAGKPFFAACCAIGQGNAYLRLGRYEPALAHLDQARETFVDLDIEHQSLVCDVNRSVVLLSLDRNLEALALLRSIIQRSADNPRPFRTAYCYANMGLCHARLGQYERALACERQAQHIFLTAQRTVQAALIQLDIGQTYLHLGQYQAAGEQLRQARQVFVDHALPLNIAQSDFRLASLYLAQGQPADALACLHAAAAAYAQANHTIHSAICDREIARVLIRQANEADPTDHQQASPDTLLNRAKTTLFDQGLPVEAALCDIALGDQYLQDGVIQAARTAFEAALTILTPGFPDDAWQAEYGLGCCALAEGDRALALRRWVRAVTLVAQIRANLLTEPLSGGYFAIHQSLFKETLRLALALNETATALHVAETSKSHLTGVGLGADWRHLSERDSAYATWIKQEAELRHKLDRLRRGLRVMYPTEFGMVLRDIKTPLAQSSALEEFTQLAHEYEQVVERLRLFTLQTEAPSSKATLSAERFYQITAQRLPPGWLTLAYYLLDDRLVVFQLDDQSLTAQTRPVTPLDRMALRQCTDTSRDFREMTYRGTLDGQTMPGQAPPMLERLTRLLLPHDPDRLGQYAGILISPHDILHALPFHALPLATGPLASVVPLAYLPSLTIPQHPTQQRDAQSGSPSLLAVGLTEFGERATPLPHTHTEVKAVEAAWGPGTRLLWGEHATRETLLRLSDSGELARFAVLHVATHAVLDPLAPSQSRIILHDDDLTYVDILNLHLGPCLVVLSACEGALGKPYPGDELMGLARAFLRAGAFAVVTSLWPVEDTATLTFMRHFYAAFQQTGSVAVAVQQAQTAMLYAGYPAYAWAPFIAIGGVGE